MSGKGCTTCLPGKTAIQLAIRLWRIPRGNFGLRGKLFRVFVVLVCVGFFVARAELKGDEALLSVERNG